MLPYCRQMKWSHLNPYEYHPERGLYYHEVAPKLLCGSQPQTPQDIEQLHAGSALSVSSDSLVSISTPSIDLILFKSHLHLIRYAAEGVTNIVNLQEDKDFAYWGVDFEAYRRRAVELGMFLDRRPVSCPGSLPNLPATCSLSLSGPRHVQRADQLREHAGFCLEWKHFQWLSAACGERAQEFRVMRKVLVNSALHT